MTPNSRVKKLAVLAAALVIQPLLADTSTDSSVQGIHGGDRYLRGIHGGDRYLRGIHGGDRYLRGIHGGDRYLRGIHGGDRYLRGIHGGDRYLRGIHGGDRYLRGIHGGDRYLRGIHGGDRYLRTEELIAGAMGPVEFITDPDSAGKVLVGVLGQAFLVEPSLVADLAVGDYAHVATLSNGVVVDKLNEPYVPGASPVWLKGIVDGVEDSVAQLSVGPLILEYGGHLSARPDFQPSPGQVIEFVGTQPAMGGHVLLFSGDDGSLLDGGHAGGASLRIEEADPVGKLGFR